MIIQGEPACYEERIDTLTNSRLIIEVSKSTDTNYDRRKKFKHYRSIPELQEYVLINQYELEIQQYTKSGDGFWYQVYESAEDVVKFGSVDVEMTVAEIYEGVSFEEVELSEL